MKYLPKNTLAHYAAAPQVRLHNMHLIPASVFGTASHKYKENCGQTSPDEDAMSFYAVNHCAALVKKSFTPNEPLPEWAQTVMESYMDVCTSQGLRMLHYILVITTREMRHLKTMSATLEGKISKAYGQEMVDFIKSIKSYGGEETAMTKYFHHAPPVSIVKYAEAIAYGFHKGSWSSGYGGPAWGTITDALVSMLQGNTSLEMLVDTGFTLAHNNGPIFNKGMMYQHYSGDLIHLLDVQASGQIPELVLDAYTGHPFSPTDVAKKVVRLTYEHLSKEFQGFVDWTKVAANCKNGNTSWTTKHVKYQQMNSPKTIEPPKPMTIGGQKAVLTGETFEVLPGLAVPIFKRVA